MKPSNAGKGANAIISMLHHFFSIYGFEERSVHLHADNSVGQDKNRFVMYYLMWRVMSGLHDNATISFLPVGYTKFAPDLWFGLTKQCFRKTKIGDLDDIANCVNLSSAVDVPQLVGSLEGTVFVLTNNCREFFDDIVTKSALKGISWMHQFCCNYLSCLDYLGDWLQWIFTKYLYSI